MESFTASPSWLLLAQEAGRGVGFTIWPLVAIFVLFYFMLIRPERQKQRNRHTLEEGLKKNDRVITVGGIYGVVTNVQRDTDEVTLKVDEANNTKIRTTISSIARVITEDSGDSKSENK